LTNFFDNIYSPFSVHKFCEIALEKNNADIGNHWKPNITIAILIQLFEKEF